jgi:hypothetical protein
VVVPDTPARELLRFDDDDGAGGTVTPGVAISVAFTSALPPYSFVYSAGLFFFSKVIWDSDSFGVWFFTTGVITGAGEGARAGCTGPCMGGVEILFAHSLVESGFATSPVLRSVIVAIVMC